MSTSSSASADPSRHRRYKPGSTSSSFEPGTDASRDVGFQNWRPALAALAQDHADRFVQLEERLSAAERLASDLAGQIRELR